MANSAADIIRKGASDLLILTLLSEKERSIDIVILEPGENARADLIEATIPSFEKTVGGAFHLFESPNQKIAFVTSAHLRTDALKIWSIIGSFSIGKTEAAIEFETRMRV